MPKDIKPNLFKDQHVVFAVTHWVKPAVVLSINNLISILKQRHDVILIIIDSASGEDIKKYLNTIQHERIIIEYLDKNYGKAYAVNNFIARHIDKNCLPKTIWSMDADVLFDLASFDYLLEAVENLDQIGMLGMRYKKNQCNPERNLFFPPKKMRGGNGKIYSVSFPFLANVAGPLFAIKGELLKNPLNFKLFPVKYYKEYMPDDAAIYDKLKRHGYKSGYLNDTLVIHLKSGDFIAEELKRFMEQAE